MKYTTPVVEVEMFEAVDVIRTSPGQNQPPTTPFQPITD